MEWSNGTCLVEYVEACSQKLVNELKTTIVEKKLRQQLFAALADMFGAPLEFEPNIRTSFLFQEDMCFVVFGMQNCMCLQFSHVIGNLSSRVSHDSITKHATHQATTRQIGTHSMQIANLYVQA